MTYKNSLRNIIPIIMLLLVFNTCKKELPIKVKAGAIINNITIISADDNKVNSFLGYVVIDGDKIIYADSIKPHLDGAYQKVNGKGKFLIPGLMDSHVHLANTAGLNGQLKNKYPDIVDAYFEQLPRSYLYHGFTTLVSEAQKYNLPVLLHAPSLEGHQVGLESGVKVFAHGLWN